MIEDGSAHLRVQHYYGELLAEFRRTQADIAAEQDAKLAAWCTTESTAPSEPTPTTVNPAPFDEDDFSNNTWLR